MGCALQGSLPVQPQLFTDTTDVQQGFSGRNIILRIEGFY
jgi:hypothetical protein